MLKEQSIVCISSIDWDFVWQGHQEIMSAFAANGNKVLFIENTGVRNPRISDIPRLWKRLSNWRKSIKGIRREGSGLYVYSPIVLPFPYFRIARFINRHILLQAIKRWMDSVDADIPVIWTFLPTALTLDIANGISHKLLIYYCIDNFRASSEGASRIGSVESQVIKMADLVFVTSKELYDYCALHNTSVHNFPFAVDIKNFESARIDNKTHPKEFNSIKRPVAGYMGGIHKWIDLNLVKDAAVRNPDISFVMVGPVQTNIDILSGLPNVYILGQRSKKEVPYYVKEFDVCLIPYLITDYTRNVYPTKMNEYLSMGKPVVSTDLPEVGYFLKQYPGTVDIAKSPEDFNRMVRESCCKKPEGGIFEKRFLAASKNSWESRIEGMSLLIEKKICEKSLEKESKWRENLLKLYHVGRARAVKYAAILGVSYLAIFHTPLVWWAASPLKVHGNLQKADAIVVFSGGVGESGKAGQGYEERVGYAVELYKKGYAKHLVFSSGYKYFFDETLLMKALAMALDVPKNDIILEDRAANTHENVKFTSAILKKQGWNSILLVSSPYHMLRVSLVFKKSAGDIKVFCAPLPKSDFYSHNTENAFVSRVTLKQAWALLHEYLAVGYYFYKGYA